MFDCVGWKIQRAARLLCWIGIAASVIGSIAMFVAACDAGWSMQSTYYIILGIVILVAGALGSWVGSMVLYGFGELIERAVSIDRKLSGQANALQTPQSPVAAAPVKMGRPVWPEPQPAAEAPSDCPPWE